MATQQNPPGAKSMADHGPNEVRLFWACFFSIVATAFGFIVRSQIIGDWGTQFGLDETQKGEILGVGLWPFAISIVLFSLIVDKIGYGKAMVFAFLCHVVSALMTIFAKNYSMLYWGTFIVALGNGTVEAVANPVVATMFPRQKTKWLNILHAGWPGGLVLGGIIALLMGSAKWEYKVALIFIPTALYAIMMLGRHFPVHERVAAGVSYRDMLKEAGFLGALIVAVMMVRQLGTVFSWSDGVQIGIIAAVVIAYGLYVQSPGRVMFIFLVLVMIPLATTELGTDSWVTDLMTPVMGKNAGWILVYTSFIMMVLRFFAGSIVHRISPLGLLAVSATIAACGLFVLSKAAGFGILAGATIFAFGKTFFWPTTLGLVSERFPRGGALTMNMIAGVGMLGVGIVGSPFIGNVQDRAIDQTLLKQDSALHQKVVGDEHKSVFGTYRAIDPERVKALPPAEHDVVTKIQENAKQGALAKIAILPVIMLACYLTLIFYFRSQGGYKAVDIAAEQAAMEKAPTGA